MEIFPPRGYFEGVIRLLALLLLCAWGAVVPSAAQNSATSRWVTVYFNERPPFSSVEGQTGILVELTKIVLAEAGVHARFIELPTTRILEVLKTGQPDALGIGWFLTPERAAWGRYSAPIYRDKPLVAVISTRVAASLGNPVRLENLLASGLTLGHKEGSSFGSAVDEKIRAQGLIPVETVVGIPQLLKMIQVGRMDYTLLSSEEAEYLFQADPTLASGLVLTKLLDPPPGNLRYLLYSGTFDPSLATRIDAAIVAVRQSPRYVELTTPRL